MGVDLPFAPDFAGTGVEPRPDEERTAAGEGEGGESEADESVGARLGDARGRAVPIPVERRVAVVGGEVIESVVPVAGIIEIAEQ